MSSVLPPKRSQTINAHPRAANDLSVGQIDLKANRRSRSNAGLSSRDDREIGQGRRVATSLVCTSTRIITAYDLSMIYIVAPGHGCRGGGKLCLDAICRAPRLSGHVDAAMQRFGTR
jgi:phosphoketolase